MFSKNEVIKESVKYFNGDMLAAESWVNKYCLQKDGEYKELTPDTMHKRLAKEFSKVEGQYPNELSEDELFNVMKDFTYIIPQGGLMAGVGNNERLTSLSNCFVIESPHDSYQGIIATEAEMISLMKRRGGVGLAIDSLRPKDVPTSSVAVKSSGIVLFAERYSNATREVAQDGRRGALMLSCRVDHPDIELFIEAKANQDKITGANVSIAITDEFMHAVEAKADYITSFNAEGKLYSTKKSANNVWDKLVHNAWASAEPGILFMDTIHRESPARGYGKKWKEVSTNPCGEIPLPPNDSCRLLAVNLLSFVKNPWKSYASFDMSGFKYMIGVAQRMMDDVVTLEISRLKTILHKIKFSDRPYDLKSKEMKIWSNILEMAQSGRRTGLGITAEGDMLAALNLTYGSAAATAQAEAIHKAMAIESYTTSILLAKERGAFPLWSKDKDLKSDFFQRLYKYLPKDIRAIYSKYGRRNIGNMTIAPTGTTSLMTQTTSGIEPVFDIMYNRRRKVANGELFDYIDDMGDKWKSYKVFHKGFADWYDINWYKLRGVNRKKRTELKSMDDATVKLVFEQSPYYKATAGDIDWVNKVRMQGAIQKWIDHSISVTVNLPNFVTEKLVGNIYKAAWKSGCKGITVYRDGSRSAIMSSSTQSTFSYSDAPSRDKILDCDIYRKTVLGEQKMILVGLLEGKPFEMYVISDVDNYDFPKSIKSGKITKLRSRVYSLEGSIDDKSYNIPNIISLLSEVEGAQTLNISLQLRHGINPRFIKSTIDKYATITSFDKAVSRVLSNYIQDYVTKEACPTCGGKLIYKEGCLGCESCDYSKCG